MGGYISMWQTFYSAAAVIASTATAAAVAAPVPAPIEVFGNWAVACDNGLRCMAVSLLAKEDDYKGVGLVITRDTGPDARATISLRHIVDGHHGPASIVIDGRVVVSGQIGVDNRMLVPGEQVSSVIASLAAGQRIQLTGVTDTSDTSLEGASAAFRYMDAQQGRVSTVTALVAKGGRSAVSVPVGAIPAIRAVRPIGAAPPLAEATKAALWARSRCEGRYDHDGAFTTQALSDGNMLVLVSCGMDSPYNHFQDPYVVRGASIAVAPFDAPVGMGERGAQPSIVTGGWDKNQATLSSYERGRALGDCASAETFVWDGTRFRLVERQELDQCRGGMSLLTTWRAQAVFRDVR